MLEPALRTIAIALSVVVALGFVLFALDDAGRASSGQVRELYDYQVADPTPAGEREREQRHGAAREAVDDANDVLLKPYASITGSSGSRWVRRGVPALLALLVYGLGLGFLARFARGRAYAAPMRRRRPASR